MEDLEKIKQVAVIAAKEAGDMLLQHFKHLKKEEIHYKFQNGRKSPVTDYDLQANIIIKKHISDNFPDHDLLSEETPFENNLSDWIWVIDPLDGTRNYINEKKEWGVSIGVFGEGKLQVGVIYIPLERKVCATTSDSVASYDFKLKVNTDVLNKGLVTLGSSHRQESVELDKRLHQTLEPVLNIVDTSGAAVVDLLSVAGGQYASVIYPDIYAWDVAAGVLLIRKAGGKATNLAGKEWDLQSKNLFASNGKIHDEIIKLINKS